MREKIVYLEGRPHAHLLHRRLAEAVCDQIAFIDPTLRWQDRKRSFPLVFISWIVNAVTLALKFRGSVTFLIDNLHFTPVIMNWVPFLKRKKIIVHLGSHTMYFIYSRQFTRLNAWLHLRMLRAYDAIICEGDMTRKMVEDLIGRESPPTYVSFLGPPEERFPVLQQVRPDLEAHVIVILANGPGKFRMFYKGVDLMVRAFQRAWNKNRSLRLVIIGEWSADCRIEILAPLDDDVRERVKFTGRVESIEEYFRNTSLCLHCSRGDAFPTATLEALAAGVPTMVSHWTGTKEVVEQIDPSFVLPLDEANIADKIIEYFESEPAYRIDLSERARAISKNYTQELAVRRYKEIFEKISAQPKVNV